MIKIEQIIRLALEEDLGDGDHTSLACISEAAEGTATLYSKDNGILAGVEIAKKVFSLIDSNLFFEVIKMDGAEIKKGDVIFKISGKAQSILHAERLVLNYMQRMSGIATETNKYSNLISDYSTQILDTRKTTPNMRYFEKMAVSIGGGTNHRYGLFDMIMIKDNHIDFAGGIEKAINRVNEYLIKKNKNLKIEIEVRDFKELDKVLEVGKIHRIMLDNFTPEETKKAVDIIGGRYEIESSGGISYETIKDYAKCGVDFISVGALTHQIKSLDMSLLVADSIE
ncbi:MAG: carboxylating nicotinate-nucleotide diphosphorylase [Bacteroidota bacterium]|nr:carboxylating nicotinate-nucleotide diphosphorylase [Bacteroidota bacterium]